MKKSNIFIAIVSISLFFACFLPAILFFNRKQEAYDIWFVGDSIFAGSINGDSIPAYVAEQTGCRVLNAGFGGLTMAKARSLDYSDVTCSYSMVNISEGIKNNDLSFAALNRFSNNQYNVLYWDKHAMDLYKASVDECKYIFIEYGTNDYFLSTPIDDDYDKYNVYTYAGALRTAIENIKEGMPCATIILVTPPYNNIESQGEALEAYVAKEVEVASEYGIYVINNYELSGISEDNYEEYLFDGTHPNTLGINILGAPIVEYIKDKQK